jgi:5-methyltetrahydrofolate--homocysteine methyltransferase
MALDDIYGSILDFDAERTAELVRAELAAGTEVRAILDEALIAAMDEVGTQFSEGVLFVPEMLMAAMAMKGGLEILRPHLSAGEAKPAGVVVIGTVKGDMHDIGKSLVGMMLEGSGFQVIDLGIDVPAERFVAAAEAHQADIVGLSALLTTTMPAMQATVARFRERNAGPRIIVGGAPVNQAFAERIGADGYGEDAPGAVALARRLVADR